MNVIADILMAAGAIGAAVYCLVLGRRLRRFTDLEKGVGGAVAVLSAQVDDLTRILSGAERRADESARALAEASDRAEFASRKLELLLASLHDLPTPETESGEEMSPIFDADREPYLRRTAASSLVSEPNADEPQSRVFIRSRDMMMGARA